MGKTKAPFFISMKNFQFIPYTLIAVGLINAVYRNSESAALNTSYLLILFGSAIFLASRSKALNGFLAKKSTSVMILALSAVLILVTIVS